MSNLVDYAKDELKRIGMIDSGEEYNDWASKAILDLIELFASQDHSGFTAPYVIGVASRLAMFKPLSPLTGEDDEWNDIGDGTFQNKRYSAVFKGKDGVAYNIEGKVFTDDGEVWYTCRDSKVNVTFPYVVPDKPEYVYRNKEEKASEQGSSGDLISREETLTAFADYVGSGMSMNDYDALQDIVAKMPPVNPQEPKWIPVSERLPEENKTVMASTEYGVFPEARYSKEYGWEWAYEAGADYWRNLEDTGDTVIAWMPLPKPYKTKSEEKNVQEKMD